MNDSVTYMTGSAALQFVTAIEYEDILTDVETLDGEYMDYDEFSRELLSYIAFHGTDSIIVRSASEGCHDPSEYCCAECDGMRTVELVTVLCDGTPRIYTFTYSE